MLGKGMSTLFRKPADGKDGRLAFLKNHVPQDGIRAFFNPKRGGDKVLLLARLWKECVNLFLSLAIHRWPWSRCSCELTKGILA